MCFWLSKASLSVYIEGLHSLCQSKGSPIKCTTAMWQCANTAKVRTTGQSTIKPKKMVMKKAIARKIGASPADLL